MREFLEGLGMRPLLSESPAFPVNPDSRTFDNCVTAVREGADIFVLIIGARYGSTVDSGKSITNLEYLAAKAKGIPIYIFVLQSIIHNLPIWQNNPSADYRGIVDTPRLFEFVHSLRETKEHWIFPFEKAQDIVETLRYQLALLFMEGLSMRQKLRPPLNSCIENLSAKSLRLVMERPIGWEFLLFVSVLSDSIEDAKPLKLDLLYGLKLGPYNTIANPFRAMDWISTQCGKILGLVHSIGQLVNVGLKDAFGPKGVAGNPELICYVARRIGNAYKAVLEWRIDFNLVAVDPEFSKLMNMISNASNEIIQKLDAFGPSIEAEIKKIIEEKAAGRDYEAAIMMRFENPLMNEALDEEFERLRNLYLGPKS